MSDLFRRIITVALAAGLIFGSVTVQAGVRSGSKSFSSSSAKGSAARSSPRPTTSGPVNYKSAVPDTNGSAARSYSRPTTSGPVNYKSAVPDTKGSAARSSPRPTTSGPVNYKSAVPDTKRPRYNAPSGTNRSLLERSRTLPSQKLQSVIREKESSGPGWIGTGLLIWLLSDHDLTRSDREWVQQQIDEARKEAKEEGKATPPPPPELSDVVFNWSYPSTFPAGQKAVISVAASQGVTNTSVAVTCRLNGTTSLKDGNVAKLEWTPEKNGTVVIQCEAAGLTDLRMFSAGISS